MDKLVLAKLCEELYYNGKVTNDKTLDQRDFVQLIDAARSTAILAAYYQARKMEMSIEESGYLDTYLEEVVLPITISKRGHEVILDSVAVTLPHGYGIYDVYPETDSCDSTFIRIEAGAGWTTCGDHDEVFYEPLTKKIRLYNVPECLKKVSVLMIQEKANSVPGDAVWSIINMIFGLTLKIKGFPVDMQDDNNPNLQMVNKKIAEAQLQ